MQNNELIICYGDQPQSMTRRLLEQIKPEQGLDHNAKIGIKPNLVVPSPAEDGATTHPEIVEAIVLYFQERGFRNLVILEGSWVGSKTSHAFKRCGYQALAKKLNVPLIDLQEDDSVPLAAEGMTVQVCSQVTGLDVLINVPVLKGHCQTGMTCALKNMKGCITNREKRRFHSMGLHMPIAALSTLIRQDLIIIDGLCGDLTFEEGGHPVAMNRIIAAKDPVLADSYAAQLLGFDLSDVPYIQMAEKMGTGSADVSQALVTELNHDQETPVCQPKPLRDRPYVRQIEEDQACSACYGSLIHALERLYERGADTHLRQTQFLIGQGFKGKPGASYQNRQHGKQQALGIGACTAGCKQFIPGCPPKAKEILAFLSKLD